MPFIKNNMIATIIAPASALGGGVAVLRASGPLAAVIFSRLAQTPLLRPRQAQLVLVKDPVTAQPLDKALALYFPGPASYTGEDVLELHVHGGRAVVQRILDAALALDPSIRLAEGGEFTRRAVQNGKMDLTEAEAIADLVAAETAAQAEQAMLQMGGGLRDLYEGWRGQLLRVMAHLEATIDFVDEEDVPPELFAQTLAAITPMITQISSHLDDNNLGERLRDGFVVAVIGAPNAGKSSLVNALARRDVAIVSSIAGTTRDAIEVPLNLGGYPVTIIDTAGLRETLDPIEAEGIKRAKARAAQADLILALFDSTAPKDAETLAQIDEKTLIVLTKNDLAGNSETEETPGKVLSVSTENQASIDALIAALTARIQILTAHVPRGTILLTRARHRVAVMETLAHLQRAIVNPDIALLAEDVRQAVRALGRLTGRVDVEDLLDVIFRDFCIGK